MMKILTIKQPWALCIMAGIKPVENRSWTTDYRGDVAIHAGLKMDESERACFARARLLEALGGQFELRVGVILGIVELHGVVNAMESWWFSGPNGLLLRNPRPTRPLPWRGQQMMVNCPEQFEQRIRGDVS